MSLTKVKLCNILYILIVYICFLFKVGFIFIFNLIVGTGALTLPGVFAKAGWFLSLIIIILLATISYITVTFIIEAMAAANAVRTWQNLQVLKRSYDVGTLFPFLKLK